MARMAKAEDMHNLFGELWLELPELYLEKDSLEEYDQHRPFIEELSRSQESRLPKSKSSIIESLLNENSFSLQFRG
jgi:hypothetical protein